MTIDTMSAMRIIESGATPRLERLPRPTPGPGEVTVDVVAVGAGLTLELARNGGLGGSFPRIIGHEIGGVVREVGANVDEWTAGDRVTTSFYLICGDCDNCRRGRETLCTRFAGFVGAAIDGGFAETVRLPARNLVRVPDSLPLDVAGIVADAIATPVHVFDHRLRTRPGDVVAVVGAGGGLGIHALQVATVIGARVIAVEADSDKRIQIDRDGFADWTFGLDWASEAAASGIAIDAVIDCVGSTATLTDSVTSLSPGGTLIVLGAAADASISLHGLDLILREFTVSGTRYATRGDIARALALVASNRVRPVVGARFELAELPDALETIRSGRVYGRVLIDVASEKSLR
ncbi:alcohol dehydrogenase catalytic domain-containing protein [Nocardia sp. NPDC052278]|uniref:alcohol dehydrogenase catalytic domain-containing protein n=1 Tax=unclassified Nocardia TaxID=2637762 RepID=UPI0036855482